MGMPDVVRHWTREEVLALPEDGKRHELVDGELMVSPSPGFLHQLFVKRLASLLDEYVRYHGLGEAFGLPGDLDLGSGQVVQPDIFVLDWPANQPPATWEACGLPRLVVEVTSPATARYDRLLKRSAYLRAGIPTYWIVDLDARLVDVWTPEHDTPTVVDDTLTWQPDPALPALTIDLPALFARTIPS